MPKLLKVPKLVYVASALPPFGLPGLKIPEIMQQMNYGCGSTVHPAELFGEPTVLYIGVGGGIEALQFAYFCRQMGGVIAVDPVPEMRLAATRNLQLARQDNDWFNPDFVKNFGGGCFCAACSRCIGGCGRTKLSVQYF